MQQDSKPSHRDGFDSLHPCQFQEVTMTAEQIVRIIASEPPELSADKIRAQRDFWLKICKEYLDKQPKPPELVDAFLESF